MSGKASPRYVISITLLLTVLSFIWFAVGADYRERNPLNYQSPVQLIYKYEVITLRGEVLNIDAHDCDWNPLNSSTHCFIYDDGGSTRSVWQGYATSVKEVGIGK